MNKCVLGDCAPPLQRIVAGVGPMSIGMSLLEIAAYHAERNERADFVIMLGSCCFSKEPRCELQNQKLRRDHAALVKAGRRVAPLFDYLHVTQHPLATARMLLRWAPYLGTLDPERPRLEEAAKLTGKKLGGGSAERGGRHSGLISYLASKNFTLVPTSQVWLTQMTNKRATDERTA
jgi:hypothetical protein